MKKNLLTLFLGFLGGVVGATLAMHFDLSFIGAARADSPKATAVVEARDFRLVDEQGKVRAALSMSKEGGVALFFMDSQGRNRMNLGLYPPNEAELPFVVLNDKTGNAAGIFRLVNESPYLILKSKGHDRSIYGLNGAKDDPFMVNFVENTKKPVFGTY